MKKKRRNGKSKRQTLPKKKKSKRQIMCGSPNSCNTLRQHPDISVILVSELLPLHDSSPLTHSFHDSAQPILVFFLLLNQEIRRVRVQRRRREHRSLSEDDLQQVLKP